MEKLTISFMEGKNLGPAKGLTTADFSQSPILIIKGLNGNGKSFFGEILFDLLRGKFPSNPLTDGELEG
jgi:hypothetical protein